jgi:hypothetical protein
MKSIEVNLPMDVYDKLVAKFGSQKRIEDLFTIKLENRLKAEVYLSRKRVEEFELTKTLTVYVKDGLYPYLNEYCIHRSVTKGEMLMKMIKKVLSR